MWTFPSDLLVENFPETQIAEGYSPVLYSAAP